MYSPISKHASGDLLYKHFCVLLYSCNSMWRKFFIFSVQHSFFPFQMTPWFYFGESPLSHFAHSLWERKSPGSQGLGMRPSTQARSLFRVNLNPRLTQDGDSNIQSTWRSETDVGCSGATNLSPRHPPGHSVTRVAPIHFIFARVLQNWSLLLVTQDV